MFSKSSKLHSLMARTSLFQTALLRSRILSPKLSKAVLTPTHFDKMKVGNATRVLSRDVSSALRYLVEKEG